MPRKRVSKQADPEAEAFRPPPESPATAEGSDSDAFADPQKRFAAWSTMVMTGFEKKVWQFLGKEDGPWGFEPQQIVGPFTLDFLSRRLMLAIEADGPTHIHTVEKDMKRDKFLAKEGILVLRLTPGDFVRHTPQQLYDLVEFMARPEHAFKAEERGKA
jgi:very-short-patch-repair endonuclease